jgi:DNA-binding winged helix-turn-helix (wHTH) protein
MSLLWPDAFVEESNLTQNIFLLRKVFGEDGDRRQFIETIPRRGYRFAADVRIITPSNDPGQADPAAR